MNHRSRLESECPKVSALELFVGFDSNEITYLEHNLLSHIREAMRAVIR